MQISTRSVERWRVRRPGTRALGIDFDSSMSVTAEAPAGKAVRTGSRPGAGYLGARGTVPGDGRPPRAIRAQESRRASSLQRLQALEFRLFRQQGPHRKNNFRCRRARGRHTSSRYVSLVRFALRKIQWNARIIPRAGARCVGTVLHSCSRSGNTGRRRDSEQSERRDSRP